MTINTIILIAVNNLQRRFPNLSFEYVAGQILIAVLFGIAKTSTTGLVSALDFINAVTEDDNSPMFRLLAFLVVADARIALDANVDYINDLTGVLVPAFANGESVAILNAFEEAAQGTDYEYMAAGLAAAVRVAADRAARGLDPRTIGEEVWQVASLHLTDED